MKSLLKKINQGVVERLKLQLLRYAGCLLSDLESVVLFIKTTELVLCLDALGPLVIVVVLLQFIR